MRFQEIKAFLLFQVKFRRKKLKIILTITPIFNFQINIELYASYFYTAMWAHFDRDDVALSNVAK